MDLKKLKENVEEFLIKLGYSLYDIDYLQKKKHSVLTVYIDKPEGITIDDCVDVSQQLSPYLDELDPIKEEYFLEVSSPGAEKELKGADAIKAAIGKFVHVETYEQKLEGHLESFDGAVLVLKIRNKLTPINYEDVNLIRLAIKF